MSSFHSLHEELEERYARRIDACVAQALACVEMIEGATNGELIDALKESLKGYLDQFWNLRASRRQAVADAYERWLLNNQLLVRKK